MHFSLSPESEGQSSPTGSGFTQKGVQAEDDWLPIWKRRQRRKKVLFLSPESEGQRGPSDSGCIREECWLKMVGYPYGRREKSFLCSFFFPANTGGTR